MPRPRLWTPELDDKVRRCYASLGPSRIGRELGVDPELVRRRARQMGLVALPTRRWTEQEDAALEAIYRAQGYTRALTAMPGRTRKSVNYRLYQLGLRGTSRRAAALDRRGLDASALDAALAGLRRPFAREGDE